MLYDGKIHSNKNNQRKKWDVNMKNNIEKWMTNIFIIVKTEHDIVEIGIKMYIQKKKSRGRQKVNQ